MTIFDSIAFMKKYKMKNDTMKESDLHRTHNYPFHPKNSKIFSDKGFISIDNGGMGGSHWIRSFLQKIQKSFYFDSFAGQPDEFSLQKFAKPKVYHIFELQDINSRLGGKYRFYFFYLIERLNYFDGVLKINSEEFNMAINKFRSTSGKSEIKI